MVSGRLPVDATQRRPDDGPPRALGPWELLQELGRGAMGSVWLARRPGLERLFALKLVRADGDPEADERLRREARLASRLEHPGIVPCLDVGSDPARGLRWLAMEFVPGTTLEAVRRARGRLTPAEAADLVADVAEAVGAAHAAGVVHRDLKPANVMVDARSGRPRVTDFGLARDLRSGEALTRTGDLLGTPAYMAPEQVMGERADARSDVWALGAILYELLTGARPVQGGNLIELAQAHAREELVPPSRACPEVPPELEAVCLRALRRDPAARWADARELAEALRAAAGSGSDPAAPAPGAPRGALVAALLVAAAALLLAGGLLVERAGRVPRAVHEAALAEAGREARRAREALEAGRAALAEAEAGRAEARREVEELERELHHACTLQAGPQDGAGAALGWVLRELEQTGAAPSLQARLLLLLARGEEALRRSRPPWPEGPEGLELLALRIRVALTTRDRAMGEEAGLELLRRAPAGSPLRDLAELTLALGPRSAERARLMARLRASLPDEPTLLWLLMVLLRGEHGEAPDAAAQDELIAVCDRFLRHIPCDPQLLETRAMFFWRRWVDQQRPADLERALRDLRLSRSVAPIAVSDWLNPGICLVSLGLPRAATFELEEALRQTEGPAAERTRARTWLGNAWMRRGDEARAARWWDEAIAEDRASAGELGEHLELASPELRARLERALQGVPLARRYQVPRR